MRLPEIWTREVWARAAAPAIPRIREVDGHLVADATAHHADYVGQDLWVVDWLPGRQFDRQQATAAMRIAVAPERLDVDRWAAQLGLTAREARPDRVDRTRNDVAPESVTRLPAASPHPVACGGEVSTEWVEPPRRVTRHSQYAGRTVGKERTPQGTKTIRASRLTDLRLFELLLGGGFDGAA
ncbi:hypothetical protein [Nocardia sp. NPDC051570]|uniref:hypothetical protein n=1 Tax=Nocardia sp. NPDC051570 TaxID=3364324 RepID=UPI003799EC60